MSLFIRIQFLFVLVLALTAQALFAFPTDGRRPDIGETKVKDEIERINKEDERWEAEFQTARPLFEEAVAKYLKLKESSAGV